MLKKVNNKIRRSLSKSGDKKEEAKKKKSNQKKLDRASQTSFEEGSKEGSNVSKKLDFKKMISKKVDNMDKNNKSSDQLKVEDQIPFIESDLEDEVDDERSLAIKEEQLPKTCKILESENGKVILIGTAHFSEESCKDVEYVMRTYKPDVVVLEICHERVKTLMLDEEVLKRRIENFTFAEANHIIKEYGFIQGIIQILFLYVSKEITKQTGMLPGSEIRTALKELKNLPNTLCRFGDRPFYITFKRAVGTLTPFQKLKLFFSLMINNPKMTKEEVEHYKQHDVLEAYLAELGTSYPMMKKALVDERDMYLAYQLQLAATLVPRGENAVYTQRVRESRNSLASIEQQLSNCKHELDNFKKIKSKESNGNQDQQIEEYELKLENLKNHYNKMHEQVIFDTEKLTDFSKQLNSKEDHFGPAVVVGIVGMGHVPGIQRYFGKVSEDDVKEVIKLPEPTLQSVVISKVIKYSFYTCLVYGFCRYALPRSLKDNLFNLSIKSANLSKEFLTDKLVQLRKV